MIERLKQFIDSQGISPRQFEIKTELTNGVISRAIKNGTSLHGDSIVKIATCWKNLNMHWLLSGEGEMYKSDDEKLSEMLKAAKADAAYWKELLDTFQRALKEKQLD